MDDYTHKIRGQHPEARNNQIADTEIMIERETTPMTLHLEDRWTNLGTEKFEPIMKIKDKDRSHFKEDRCSYSNNLLTLTDRAMGHTMT
eukprot:7542501-Heterocapsa_arctica.AAC.1